MPMLPQKNSILRISCISLLLLFFCLSAKAQLNLKIGYSLGLSNPAKTNEILKQFNADNPWLDNKFKDLNLMSGIMIGFRNKWDFAALELSWTSKFNRERAEGDDPMTGDGFTRTFFYRLNTISAGLEFYLTDNFSIGGSVDATDLNYKVEGTGFPDTEKVVDQFNMGSHFFLSYEVNAGDYMSVAFRPYIQMPWETFNITGFERANYPDSTVPESEFEESLMNFGIMFIFYNGQQ